ncbi:helix-turn-helix domain-containing protein [Mucilaginibacter sp.]|uniref:helix-turn-helix domain-containing protein n=1 Tax=Mucilaginibacter sp. TaxID=1882438 RepID=UPI003D14C2E2
MRHQEFEPPEELRDIIKCFWYNKRDAEDMRSSFEVQPDSYAEIIFHFGSDLSTVYNGLYQALPSPFMVGLLNKPVIFNSENCLEIIGVRCFPWTVFDLLGLPPGKDHVHIFDHPLAELRDTLAVQIRTGNLDEGLDMVKRYFLNVRLRLNANSLLLKAGIAMQRKHGTIRVSQVAAEAHATVRTLERNFKQCSGYSVKDISCLMRFEKVRNLLWLHPDSNIARLVQDLGYTDRSHLTREFKRYSGTSPAAFARHSKLRKIDWNADIVALI